MVHNVEKKQVSKSNHFSGSQLWKLENKTLKNKDGFWKSDDLWIFKPKDDDMFYIENTNETKVLESSDGKVNEEVKKENKAEQLWKKGELDASGEFVKKNNVKRQQEYTNLIIF